MRIRRAAWGATLALSLVGAAAAGTSPASLASPALPASPASSALPTLPASRSDRVQAIPAGQADEAGRAAPKGIAAADPVQEKFRKLQREMSGGRSEASDPGATSLAGATGKPASIFSITLQIVLGLVFVLVLAVVTIRLLKRFQGSLLSRRGQARGEIFEVLETCHLGTHQRVVAIRMRDEVGILGVTPQGISLLTTLKEPAEEIRKEMLGDSNPAAFSDSLNKLLDRFRKPKRVSDLLDEA